MKQTTRPGYVHLHGHSENSLQDGVSRIPHVIEETLKGGMNAIALTDHGVMYGSLEFYKAAVSKGVKPILGCELYVCKNRLQKESNKKEGNDNRYYHLVALAMNKVGYLNLLSLVSEGQTSGMYYKPRVDHELIERHSEGIIFLSACLGGEVSQRIIKGDLSGARAMAQYYRDVLCKPGCYYLEMQDHGFEDPLQRNVNAELRKISKELDIPLVVTNDYHYSREGDDKHHCLHVCAGRPGQDMKEAYKAYETRQHYIKTPEQMYELFPDDHEALMNTVRIAERCNVMIEMGKYMLPEFPVPEGFTESSYLRHLSWEGLAKRGLSGPEYEERLKYELNMIDQMGFPGYFLIVSDYIGWARNNGVPVGAGRGSAAGSLVAYCTEITDIDPIKNSLLFERFLNPSRISMPDIDTDFCIEGRGKVIEYVRNKYGSDRVAKIGTFGTLGVKSSIKDVARSLEIPFELSDKMSKMVPETPDITFDDVMVDGCELYAAYQQDATVKKVVDLARSLGPYKKDGKAYDGIRRNTSVHAAGVIISRDNLWQLVPLRSDKDFYVTGWTMGECEEMGLLKMDFLGLRNLTVMERARVIIKESLGIDIDVRNLPLDDPKVYRMLTAGDVKGVFQLEASPGAAGLTRRLAPTCFEDISALVALNRPGPLESGIVEDYINRKEGKEPVVYVDPRAEEVLKNTFGCMIYQEQIMQLAQVLGGYTMAEADNLRKIIGKKDKNKFPEAMAKLSAAFVKGGISEEKAIKLCQDIEKFAAYGFNKSHSAAYAMLCYQTAWLKVNYPVHFMAALISSVTSDKEKVQAYIEDCRKMGIRVLPPDINHSVGEFTVAGEDIRFGLNAIKNVGFEVVREVVAVRRRAGAFADMNHFFAEVGISVCNKRVLESMIWAGAFDSFGIHRAALVEQAEQIREVYKKAKSKSKKQIPGQTTLFALKDKFVAEPVDVPEVKEVDHFEMLGKEKELIGVYVSGHPLDDYLSGMPYLTTVSLKVKTVEAEEEGGEDAHEAGAAIKDGEVIAVAGVISSFRKTNTKTGHPMAMGEVMTEAGTIRVVWFPKTYEAYGHHLGQDAFVHVVGKAQLKDGKVEMIADKVGPLEDAKVLVVTLPPGADVSSVVSARPYFRYGMAPVVFRFGEDSQEHIVAHPSFWVDPSVENVSKLERCCRGATIEVKQLF